MSAILILLWLPLAHVHAAHDEAADKAYIRQAESDWAEPLVTNDVSVLQRVLADDFVGVTFCRQPVFQSGCDRRDPESFLIRFRSSCRYRNTLLRGRRNSAGKFAVDK